MSLPTFFTIWTVPLGIFFLGPNFTSETSKPLEFSSSTTQEAPNILLIIADDMGLDASPWFPEYGTQKPSTPNLDQLADTGLVFENAWSNPVCSPTRAGILTGKYGVHTGVLGPLSRNEPGIGLEEISLQSYIQDNNPTEYAQAIIGKWHLSTTQNGSNENPGLMGVPHYSGLIGGGVKAYDDWSKITNGVTTKSNDYITSVFTNEAIDWVEDQNKPWFLWLAYTAPHTPFHLPPQDLISDKNLDGSDIESNPMPYYLAAIEAMDHEVGRLLASMSTDERDNTIVIFMGDNGTPNQVAQAPFSRSKVKGSLYQGGVNIPLIVTGPGLETGRTGAMINTSDLFATIVEMTGLNLDTYENSVSFWPLLSGQKTDERDWLYAEINTTSRQGEASRNNGWTVRDERYKLIVLDSGEVRLFDLEADPYENKNLAEQASYADKVDQLKLLGETIRD